jgi:hypothetical protein
MNYGVFNASAAYPGSRWCLAARWPYLIQAVSG